MSIRTAWRASQGLKSLTDEMRVRLLSDDRSLLARTGSRSAHSQLNSSVLLLLNNDPLQIYTDYSVRSRLVDVAPRRALAYIPMFSDEELEAMITTAHFYGVKVAAHSVNQSTIHRLLQLGVDSIEHGHGLTTSDTFHTHDSRHAGSLNGYDAIPILARSNIFWVPTLAVYHTSGGDMWEQAKKNFQTALKHPQFKDVKMACGGDTGPFPHGDNALELKLMVRLGAAWQDVLSWATLGGWECIRPVRSFLPPDTSSHDGPMGDNEVAFGLIQKGRAADIIAVAGDLEKDFEATIDKSSVKFVMKSGRVYKDLTD
jgi:imidazolonepropionase-like amidohydrolase